jgi:hypothetical protein
MGNFSTHRTRKGLLVVRVLIMEEGWSVGPELVGWNGPRGMRAAIVRVKCGTHDKGESCSHSCRFKASLVSAYRHGKPYGFNLIKMSTCIITKF